MEKHKVNILYAVYWIFLLPADQIFAEVVCTTWNA
jgi:hypothetical protein